MLASGDDLLAQMQEPDMLQISSCPLCRGTKLKTVSVRTLRVSAPNGDDRQAFANFMLDHVFQTDSATASLMICRTCYFVFYDHQLTPDEVARLYNPTCTENIRRYLPTWGVYADPAALELNKQRRAEAIFERISSAIPGWSPTKVLDFGGSTGENMRALPHSAERYVFDLSTTEVEAGVTLLDSMTARAPYDCVMANHILEHVTDVRSQWDKLIGLLAPDGYLYIEVPIEFQYQLRRGRGLGENEHIQFFTQTSLRYLARASGMTTLFVKNITHAWGSGTLPSICGLFQKASNRPMPAEVPASPFAFAAELAQVLVQRVAGKVTTRLERRGVR
jgi:hypothetical protein